MGLLNDGDEKNISLNYLIIWVQLGGKLWLCGMRRRFS